MPLPRLLPGSFGVALALAFAVTPGQIGSQGVRALTASSGPASWKDYLLAAPSEDAIDGQRAEEGFDALSSLRAEAGPVFATGFVLAQLPARSERPRLAPRPAPFIDRTVRSDRLPLARGDMTPSMAAGMVTPSPLYGMAARAETTPVEIFPASSTPQTAEEPLSVASLPVQEPLPLPTAAFRLASLQAGMNEPEGVTSAQRGADEKNQSTTRLSHVLLLPGGELKAEQKCLAEAVYFEARGEPERGQYAVAQVVMNRTRSGFYPNKICKVVYQNRHRFNACQFSFACDRFPDRIYSRPAWVLAQRIAKEVTESGAWLPEVGGATHYHADYVRPYWAPKMIKLRKIGQHIFYRPYWLPDLGAEPAVSQVRRTPVAQDS